MELKLGKVFLLKNKSIDKYEIVKIQSIDNAHMVHVSHLNEEGSWVCYVDKDDIQERNEFELTRLYRANALSAKLMVLHLEAYAEHIIDPVEDAKIQQAIQLCKYEPNLYNCDISKYYEYLPD